MTAKNREHTQCERFLPVETLSSCSLKTHVVVAQFHVSKACCHMLKNLSIIKCFSDRLLSSVMYVLYQKGRISRKIMAGDCVSPPLSLPFPRSITCKDLVFRAHYFLLSSHTLSKAELSLLRLESQGFSGKQGIQ